VNDFWQLKGEYLKHFKQEWGRTGSWNGMNDEHRPAFLADLYRANLDFFIQELRDKMAQQKLHATVDTWGFADWMSNLKNRPDAFLTTPPDERWGLNWSTDLNFSLAENRGRFIKIMKEQVQSVSPTPVIYMIDHPKPFTAFKMLSDDRQVQVTQFLLDVTEESGAKFMFRGHSENTDGMGTKLRQLIQTECGKRRIYHSNSFMLFALSRSNS